MQSLSYSNGVSLRKCGIVGCGKVGATVAYSLMQTGWFSELVLLDINQKKAIGEAADLSHGLPFHSPMDIYAGTYADLTDCGIIIITAGAKGNFGPSRLDSAEVNARIFRSVVNDIAIYNQNAILLVVTNPVDILTHVTYRVSGFPPNRVIGSGTVLDTARFKQLLGSYLGVDSRQVHAFIIGEHGDSELAVWSSANVSGIDLPRYCEACPRGYHPNELDALSQKVKHSAHEIVSAKGATYYAIAESVKRIVTAIVRDESSILPVTTLLTGQYGIENVSLSLPCLVNRHGIARVLEIPLNNDEKTRLQGSAEALHRVLREIEVVHSP